MVELYSILNTGQIKLMLIISMFAVITQGAYLTNIWRERQKVFFESLILLHLVGFSLIIRNLNGAIGNSTIIDLGFRESRVIISLAVLLYGLYLYRRIKEKEVILAIILVSLVVPSFERLSYGVFTKLFVGSLTLLFLRSILLYYNEKEKRENRVSQHSVKEALDSLENGILFMEDNGYILLINKKMINIMRDLKGRDYRNGKIFWEEISNKKDSSLKNQDLMVVDIANRSWQFTRRLIEYRKREAYQIRAVDVTEHESINKELKKHDQQLRDQQEQLRTALDNIQELRKEEAISRFWEYIHGLLGQYFSLLDRMLTQKPMANKEELKEVLDTINISPPKIEDIDPERAYEDIVSTFRSLDIKIRRQGKLPKEKEVAHIFIDIVREGVNNAIRHGQAEKIYIDLMEDEREYKLQIKNDGKESPEKISWGGGFTSINKKLATIGGQLRIQTRPEFSLHILVGKSSRL